MHLQTTYLIRCVSQPLGAIVKGLALADEGDTITPGMEDKLYILKKRVNFCAGNVKI